MANPQIKTSVVAPVRERLSWQEICARYPDAWVVLTDLVWRDPDEDSDDLVSAVVIGSAKTRVDSLQTTRAVRESDGIVEYTSRFTGPVVPADHVSFRFFGL